MKLETRKAKLHKKLKVKNQEPGALIRKVNELPKPNTKIGLAIRGLI